MGCINTKIVPKSKREEMPKKKNKKIVKQKKKGISDSLPKETLSIPGGRTEDRSTKEILEELESLGMVINTRSTNGGLAFDIGETGLPLRPPRRLAKIQKKANIADICTYTAEEKGLMAEILKEDDARSKVWKEELKQDKAKRKRMYNEAHKKFKVESKRRAYDERKKNAEKKL